MFPTISWSYETWRSRRGVTEVTEINDVGCRIGCESL